MAGKHDKSKGIFIIKDNEEKRAYVGKSSSVGTAIRSAKSKLKKRKFHNDSLQSDWIEFDGKGFEFLEPILISDDEDLKIAHQRIRGEYIKDGFLLHNDIEYVDKPQKIETSELSNLTTYEQDFIRLIIKKIGKVDIDAFSEKLNNL